jgi:hypothetical protein
MRLTTSQHKNIVGYDRASDLKGLKLILNKYDVRLWTLAEDTVCSGMLL